MRSGVPISRPSVGGCNGFGEDGLNLRRIGKVRRGADGRRTIERWVGQRPHCDILRGLKPETLELSGLGVRTIGPTVHVQIGSEIVGSHPIQEQAYDLRILVT